MSEVLLLAERVVKNYGGLTAVHKLDLQVAKGEIVSLVGPNGAGKTTFFDCVTGMTAISSGKISFLGRDITGSRPHSIARMGLARTFQLPRVFGTETVLENVVIAQHKFMSGNTWQTICSLFRENWQGRVVESAMKFLNLVQLSGKERISGATLPIGERKRLELAIALATGPKLLLLDEPAAGMNPTEINQLMNVLRSVSASGMGICVVEHHMEMVMTVSDRIVVLNFGEKIAEGSPDEVCRDLVVIEAYLGKGRETQ